MDFTYSRLSEEEVPNTALAY